MSDPSNIVRGHQANLNNPRTSDEAKVALAAGVIDQTVRDTDNVPEIAQREVEDLEDDEEYNPQVDNVPAAGYQHTTE